MKRRWLAEGEGWAVFEFTVDCRVGGNETSRFSFKGGPEITYDAVIQDIVTDRRIVYAYRMTVAGKPISVSLVTVQFAAAARRYVAGLRRSRRSRVRQRAIRQRAQRRVRVGQLRSFVGRTSGAGARLPKCGAWPRR